MTDRARWFQNIPIQLLKQILHTVDNNILQNLRIPQEDAGMDEDIYINPVWHIFKKKSPPQGPECGAYHSKKCPQGYPW